MTRDTITITIPTRAAVITTALAIGGIFGGAVSSFADGDPATSSVDGIPYILPYEGFLQVDGVPLDGQVDMQFEISTTSNPTIIWSEVQPAVQIHDGRFSVGLGAMTPLKDIILDAERYQIRIHVLEPDGAGGSNMLSFDGRALLVGTPQAAWVASTARFNTEGDLTVEGNGFFDDSVNVYQNLDLTGALVANADVNLNGTVEVLGDATFGATTTLVNPVSFPGGVSLGTKALTFETAANRTFSLTGSDLSYPSTGITLRPDTSPNSGDPLFTVLSSGGAIGLQVEHDDDPLMNNLEVKGTSELGSNNNTTTVTNTLNVTGTITNFAASSNYPNSATASSGSPGDVNMVDEDNSICFLVDVQFSDMENNDENECYVFKNSGVWKLRARAKQAATSCEARCFSW